MNSVLLIVFGITLLILEWRIDKLKRENIRWREACIQCRRDLLATSKIDQNPITEDLLATSE